MTISLDDIVNDIAINRGGAVCWNADELCGNGADGVAGEGSLD